MSAISGDKRKIIINILQSISYTNQTTGDRSFFGGSNKYHTSDKNNFEEGYRLNAGTCK